MAALEHSPGRTAPRRPRVALPPLLPMAIAVALLLMAVFAQALAPQSPTVANLGDKLLPPAWLPGGSGDHLLGTDRFGRDVLSRLIFGARLSLMISFLAIVFSGTLGTLLGLASGYLGGWVDAASMRAVDVALSLPLVLVALVLSVVWGPSFTNILLITTLLLWPRYTRQVRAETLSIKGRDFVEAARAVGCSDTRIVLRHILPNLIPSLLVLATLQFGYVILLESSLSFLGAGIPPPEPAWGLMVAEGRLVLASAWWVSVLPGVTIVATVLSANLLGDWLRDRLDPRLRRIA